MSNNNVYLNIEELFTNFNQSLVNQSSSNLENNLGNNNNRDVVGIFEDEKSFIYKFDYGKNEKYWGFGIEREFYFELGIHEKVLLFDLMENTKRERYSVDYNFNFSAKKRKNQIEKEKLSKEIEIHVPIYWTSHAIEKTDKNGQHRTITGYLKKDNPKFSGKSLLEEWISKDDFFEKEKGYGKTFLFDGDTIEIATRYFYNKTIDQVYQEYKDKKDDILTRINKLWKNYEEFKKYGEIKMAEWNYGFVRFWTNPTQIAICNNGTFHLNMTIPTYLNENSQLINEKEFLDQHLWCIRWLQWFEPFIISFLGSPDIFSVLCNTSSSSGFSDGSLRIALSRYIGMGTYDIRKREIGKILTVDKKDVSFIENDFWWLKRMEKNQAYLHPNIIGYDFNLKKHNIAGIEWRIFDSFPDEFIVPISRLMFLICDYALEIRQNIINNQNSFHFPTNFLSQDLQEKLKQDVNLSKDLFDFKLHLSEIKNENKSTIPKWFRKIFYDKNSTSNQNDLEIKEIKEINKDNENNENQNDIELKDNIKKDEKHICEKYISEKRIYEIPPIAGLTPFWNDLTYRCVQYGNKNVFLTKQEILDLNQILNIPNPEIFDSKWNLKEKNLQDFIMEPQVYLNEWCKQVYDYFIIKGKMGDCFESFQGKKCPFFTMDFNQFLWTYQWLFYTPKLNYDYFMENKLKLEMNENTKKWVKENIYDKLMMVHRIRLFKKFYHKIQSLIEIKLHKEKQKHKLRFFHILNHFGILIIKNINYEYDFIKINFEWLDIKLSFWKIFVLLQYLSHFDSKYLYQLHEIKIQHFDAFLSLLLQKIGEKQFFILELITQTMDSI